jgi:hypothetical protein
VDELDDRRGKSFNFAQDLTKQLITLATAVIALTITFHTDVAAGDGETMLLASAWIAFILCVVFGVGVLMTLTGNLERAREQPTVYAPNTVLLAKAQVLAFVAGMALTVVYGLTAV